MCGAFVYVYVGGVRYQMMGGEVERAGVSDLIARRPDLGSRFNIRPTQDVVTIVSEYGRLVAKPMRWGLIPSWANSEKIPRNTFNARDDRLADSGMWQGPFKRSRGAVPANGFYEWKKPDGSKQPMFISPKEGETLQFAAVYDSWVNEHGRTIDSCAIVTTGANDFMSSIHDRMPVILDEETVALWLDPQTIDSSHLQSILMPASNDLLKAVPVSKRVNSYKNDDQGLLDEVAIDEPASDQRQLGLFNDQSE